MGRGAINPQSPCMVNGKCSKHYPRQLTAETITGKDVSTISALLGSSIAARTASLHQVDLADTDESQCTSAAPIDVLRLYIVWDNGNTCNSNINIGLVPISLTKSFIQTLLAEDPHRRLRPAHKVYQVPYKLVGPHCGDVRERPASAQPRTPGFAFDSDRGPDLDSGYVQNIHNSPAASPA
ncbi:hypothetical protein EVAR_69014_1 [Eumeta japonica]|uniref:Uncharacterized protein n=1 Tax=Eumeta variegata TaxID=151549 RepID=A0A4C2AD28_EUMVA|nr:hypothetical protein EVAR_69014_1 [Eumeta japonica]